MQEMRLARRRIEQLLAHHTGQDEARIAADIERDYIVRGDEAASYGLVDEVIAHRNRVGDRLSPGYQAPAPAPADQTDETEGSDGEG
jgi:hypothetical protein